MTKRNLVVEAVECDECGTLHKVGTTGYVKVIGDIVDAKGASILYANESKPHCSAANMETILCTQCFKKLMLERMQDGPSTEFGKFFEDLRSKL